MLTEFKDIVSQVTQHVQAKKWWKKGDTRRYGWPPFLFAGVILIAPTVFKHMQSPRQKRPFSCFSEQLLKISKLIYDTSGYCLPVLHPCGYVDKQYSQQSWSPFPNSTNACGRGGGGWRVPKERGFSGPKHKTDTESQPVPSHAVYELGCIRYITSEWMWWITPEIAYPSIEVCGRWFLCGHGLC
jgi:hypothetical protein